VNALVLQCGGPTAVVNSSLAALGRRWREDEPDGQLFGGRFGLRALATGEWDRLDVENDAWLQRLDTTPGMALGGGRDRLDPSQLASVAGRLGSREIDVVFLIGGNGTMAAARALASGAHGPRVIAVPKTIDNDIPHTDICPGFLSAARFLSEAVRDVSDDVLGMRGYEEVVLIETMGRHAGWLAASAPLARGSADDAPHLVLMPEKPIDEDALLAQIEDRVTAAGVCVVVVSEGVRDHRGVLLTTKECRSGIERDPSGHVILGRSGGPLPYLTARIRERLGRSCRQVRPDVLQRCSRAHVSALDRRLASLVGASAVGCAREGSTGVMVAVRRVDGEWRTEPIPLDRVKGERLVPPDFDPEALRALLA
jgi:6-phosphofructokinase 1